MMRPLTPRMIKLLQECLDREVSNKPPLTPYYSQSAKGLFERGLLFTKEFTANGRTYTGFFISAFGREVLLTYLTNTESA